MLLRSAPSTSRALRTRSAITPLRRCSHAQHPVRAPWASRRTSHLTASFGKDAVDGWLDVASLVTSGGSKAKSAYGELASAIGRDVYVDVAGWHLYFRDLSAAPGLKAHDLLANLLGPKIGGYGIREQEIVDLLKKIPIKLGGGKLQVALHDVIPRACVQDLVRITEDYARRK